MRLSGQGEGRRPFMVSITAYLLLAAIVIGKGYVAAAAANEGESPAAKQFRIAGANIPNLADIVVHPVLNELHNALTGSASAPKASKKAEEGPSKGTKSDLVEFLLEMAGRTVPGPGPSYKANAEKPAPSSFGEKAASESSGEPDIRGLDAEKDDPLAALPEDSHVQLRVTGVLRLGANADAARQQLISSCRVTDVVINGRGVYAWVPAGMVPCLSTVDGVQSWVPSLLRKISAQATPVASQGDIAMRTDMVRSHWNVTGRGIKVGIISDSFDSCGGATRPAQDAGELPWDVEVLLDVGGCRRPDEGRAMAEIVHDVAPDAAIAFHSGFITWDLAQGIRRLARAGCDVIVDDMIFAEEPFFFDGTIAAAVDEVTREGVTHVSSAGNSGDLGYESRFVPSGEQAWLGDFALELHDFDPSDGIQTSQQVTAPPGFYACLVLQWDQPWATQGPWASGFEGEAQGAESDLEVFVVTEEEVVYGATNNVGGDAMEQACFYSESGRFTVSIGLLAGVPPANIKYILWQPSDTMLDIQFGTHSGTLFGHACAPLAISVGAAFFGYTPAFDANRTSAEVEGFSSKGGNRIMYDTQGRYLGPEGVLRPTPSVVGPDGTDTSFFPPGGDFDGDGRPNFFGTSAAAPHVAGLVALLLSFVTPVVQRLPPADVRSLLQASAHDMGEPGLDFHSGAGFVDGVALMELSMSVLRQRSALALLSFKQGLDAATTAGVLDDWVEGSNPCQGWTGVTCAEGPVPAVIGLSLSARGLSGALSPSLGNLTGLRVLELDDNALSGPIPHQLGNLVHARLIDLSGNQLSGGVPFSVDGLRQLEGMDLRNNAALSGCIPAGVVAATVVDGTALGGVCGDTYDSPVWVLQLPFTYKADSAVFEHDISMDACHDGTPVSGPDLVFHLVAARDAIVHASLCGSSLDTVLTISRLLDDGSTQPLACSDDFPPCGGPQSAAEVPVSANETYFFVVAVKAGNESGALTLEIAEYPLVPQDLIDAECRALQAFRAGLLPLMAPSADLSAVGAVDPLPLAPLVSWDGPNACLYEGVLCVQGRVLGIFLPEMGLTGTLTGPAQQPLLYLHRLQFVVLFHNPALGACIVGLLAGKILLAPDVADDGLCGDTSGAAVTIPSLPFEYVDDTSVGFVKGTPWSACVASRGPDVIFEYVPDASLVVTFSLCPQPGAAYATSYDSYLYVFPANRPVDHAICDDNGCAPATGRASSINAFVAAGQKYYIVVSGFLLNAGLFRLHAEPAPLNVSRVDEVLSVLMDIKSGFQNGAAMLPDWKANDAGYCHWRGVSCDRQLEVVFLGLSSRRLAGTVPAAIGRLPALTVLDLRFNSLVGSIPAELAGPSPELETRTRVELRFEGNPRMSGCVPDEIAFKANADDDPLFYVRVRASGVGGACRYARMAPVLECPSLELAETSGASFAFLQERYESGVAVVDETAPNVLSDAPILTCSPPSEVPFFEGTTPVVCRAVDADDNEGSCTLEVSVAVPDDPLARQPPPYLGSAVVFLPGANASSFTPLVLSAWAAGLFQVAPLAPGDLYDVKVMDVGVVARRSLLQRGAGVQMTIWFSSWWLGGVTETVAWFNDASAAAQMALIFAEALGVPVGVPTVSASVGGNACCLPPSPDPVCLADTAVSSSAECAALGHELLPSATTDAIWLGATGQCADCATLWDRPGARSDPHFVAAAGTHFDWMGEGDRSFCIISDKAVHVNAHLFAGTDGRRKGTWMDQIAVLHSGDHMVVSTGAPAGVPGLHGSISINGRADASVGSSASAVVSQGFTVRRRKTRTWVTVEGIMELEVEVVRASTWEAGRGPARDFLNFRVRGLNATEDVHGVLGQTFRPAGLGAPRDMLKGLVEGADPDYMTSGLLAADCSFSRFLPTDRVNAA